MIRKSNGTQPKNSAKRGLDGLCIFWQPTFNPRFQFLCWCWLLLNPRDIQKLLMSFTAFCASCHKSDASDVRQIAIKKLTIWEHFWLLSHKYYKCFYFIFLWKTAQLSWIRVSSYSIITRVIGNNSNYNSSYLRITRDSDPTLVYKMYKCSMYLLPFRYSGPSTL